MWRQNLLLVLRSFKRNKTSFLINMLGLSTSLACAILIYFWVADEYKVDRFAGQESPVYQVMQNLNKNQNEILTWEWTPGILANSLKEEFPEVERAVHVTSLGGHGIIAQGENRFKAEEMYADADFFHLFPFPLLEGSAANILQHKGEVVISKDLANRLFPAATTAVGKTVSWERSWGNVSGEYTISGVFDREGVSSTLEFDLLFSYPLYFENKPNLASWRNSDPYTFVTFKEGTQVGDFSAKIEKLMQQKEAESLSTLFIRPSSDRYLFADYENGLQAGGRIEYVRLLSLIALFVLLIACINFMNLSTARSSQRIKEVGVKKVVGARRGSLVIQFLTESAVLTFISAGIALALVHTVLPFFNELTDKTIAFVWDAQLLMTVGVIATATALLAGSYPAFFLSRFPSIQMLRGQLRQQSSSAWIRKSLVVFQFALSVLLILAVMVVYSQLDFVQAKNLGYDREEILMFRQEGGVRENTETFLTALNDIAGVAKTSTIDGDFVGNYGYTTSINWEGKDPEEATTRFGVMMVGEELIETLNIKLKAGRTYAGHFGSNGGQVILNEAAVRAIGYEEPLGKTISQRGEQYEIIGVVEDFHFESLYETVKPCLLKRGNNGRNVVVKIEPGQTASVIAQLDALHADFNPGIPFEYQFMDEEYHQLYQSEGKIAVLSRLFAGLAILISCLGLFGLAAFTVEKRAKEMSIRKILGASFFRIIHTLSRDLILLIVVAIVIAVPIGWLLANDWLNTFAFRVDLRQEFFLLAAGIAIGIAATTIGIHSIKAALANPVKALRNE